MLTGLAAALAITGAWSCGAGGGTETKLPAGPTTQAPAGKKVIYASLTRHDMVVAYRLGVDGLLEGEPFDSMMIEEPRWLLYNDGNLYISTSELIASVQLGPDGSLPDQPTSITGKVEDADPSQMLIFNNVLYAAYQDLRRIFAFPLIAGQITADAISGSGTDNSNYNSIARWRGYMYGGSRRVSRIDTYIIGLDGTLPPEPEEQDPRTRVSNPIDMLVNTEDQLIYIIEQDDQRILAFEIQNSGLLLDDESSKTKREERYAYMVRNGNALYASAFNEGRIDLYRLEPDGQFQNKQGPESKTANDTSSFPNQMILDNNILYVAQQGYARIDAYNVENNGTLPRFASSSTNQIKGSYLNSIVLANFGDTP
jgi:hypothetical protein